MELRLPQCQVLPTTPVGTGIASQAAVRGFIGLRPRSKGSVSALRHCALHMMPRVASPKKRVIRHPLAAPVDTWGKGVHLVGRNISARAQGSAETEEVPIKQLNVQKAGPLAIVNASTKWVVSGLVFAVVLARHDAAVSWCLLGSLLNRVLCKLLKTALNHSRPSNAPKADPGMPSAHAQSLSFLGTYAAAALCIYRGSPSDLALAGVIVSASLFLMSLRVVLGYHTVEQVVVGAICGALTASAWLSVWIYKVAPVLRGPSKMQVASGIYATTAFCAVWTILAVGRQWLREAKEEGLIGEGR